MINALDSSSTRPYLIRALYEWCTDNGFTPYVAVLVDESVQVPREYVKNGEIVLNIGFDATSSLKLGNDLIEFKARFAGTARDISVPVGRVIAIYARESGQGMAFPAPGTVAAGGAVPVAGVPALVPQREAERGADGDTKVVHLVPNEGADKDVVEGDSDSSTILDDDPPPRPPVGGSPRPALKRIK